MRVNVETHTTIVRRFNQTRRVSNPGDSTKVTAKPSDFLVLVVSGNDFFAFQV